MHTHRQRKPKHPMTDRHSSRCASSAYQSASPCGACACASWTARPPCRSRSWRDLRPSVAALASPSCDGDRRPRRGANRGCFPLWGYGLQSPDDRLTPSGSAPPPVAMTPSNRNVATPPTASPTPVLSGASTLARRRRHQRRPQLRPRPRQSRPRHLAPDLTNSPSTRHQPPPELGLRIVRPPPPVGTVASHTAGP